MLQLRLLSLGACLITELAVGEGNAAAKCDEALEETATATALERSLSLNLSPFLSRTPSAVPELLSRCCSHRSPASDSDNAISPSSVLPCITFITLSKLSTQHLTLILLSAVSAVTSRLTKRNTSTCVSSELPFHRNTHLRALWLQHSLISSTLLCLLHTTVIEENPLADCTHAWAQEERKNSKYNIKQHMANPFMSFYSRSGTEWESFLGVIVGSVETTLVLIVGILSALGLIAYLIFMW